MNFQLQLITTGPYRNSSIKPTLSHERDDGAEEMLQPPVLTQVQMLIISFFLSSLSSIFPPLPSFFLVSSPLEMKILTFYSLSLSLSLSAFLPLSLCLPLSLSLSIPHSLSFYLSLSLSIYLSLSLFLSLTLSLSIPHSLSIHLSLSLFLSLSILICHRR